MSQSRFRANKGTSNPQSILQEHRPRVVVIFSHGNASDLGDIFMFAQRFVQLYEVDFIGYDYTGYGLGRDIYTPTEKQLYDDLQNIIAFAVCQ